MCGFDKLLLSMSKSQPFCKIMNLILTKEGRIEVLVGSLSER
jgi:hypothetical protein